MGRWRSLNDIHPRRVKTRQGEIIIRQTWRRCLVKYCELSESSVVGRGARAAPRGCGASPNPAHFSAPIEYLDKWVGYSTPNPHPINASHALKRNALVMETFKRTVGDTSGAAGDGPSGAAADGVGSEVWSPGVTDCK